MMDSDDGSATSPAICDLRDPRSLPFTFGRTRGKLPHLFKPGCTYFVTFCLEWSCRARVRPRLRIDTSADPEDVARLSEPSTMAADPVLSLPRIARVVEDSLLHFQGQRYALHAWCVMPDHVHVLVTPFEGRPLDTISIRGSRLPRTRSTRCSIARGRFGSPSPSTTSSVALRRSRGSWRTSRATPWPPASAPIPRPGSSAARGIVVG